MNYTNDLSVYVRGDEIGLEQNSYKIHTDGSLRMITMRYDLAVEEARQLIEMIQEAIDIIEGERS